MSSDTNELFEQYMHMMDERGPAPQEPRNPGPSLPDFFKVVHRLATEGITGTFVRRLQKG